LPLTAQAYVLNEPAVERDSPAIRAVLQERVTNDPFPLFVARSKLGIAEDRAAEAAIDGYLTAMAIARVTGSEAPARATVADVVTNPIGLESMAAAIDQVLAATLRFENPTIDEKTPALRVTLRNVGKLRVNQFDAAIEVRLPQREAIRLRCNEPSFSSRPIGPGETILNECRGSVTVADLTAAIADPSALQLVVDRVNWEDPSVSLTSRGAVWIDTNGFVGPQAAHTKARAELGALSCIERNACVEDFRRMLGMHPLIVLGVFFAVFGALMGAGIAAATRRRWWWGLGLAGVLTLAVAGAVTYLLMANNLMGLLLLIAGPVACVAFVAGMVPALALIRRRKP
jgi:hypothetical protein